ncbi:WD repeat-containing protein [Apis cerana cerana]|uniref:WD repeat-containing protein n=1 Tax=Apis cerana cerana TaxID=94128 RepID=A0A2A3E340_APICC|nr:WD repeat-containing protein [Apis cerana cerana]
MADEFEKQNEKKEKNEQADQNNKSIQNEYDKQSEEEDKYLIEIQEPASVEDIYNNDYVEHEDYEYISKPEKGEEEEEEEKYIPEIIDWEKEAKESVRIDTSTLKERQKTIYELDSFSASGIGAEEILQLASKDFIREPLKEIRYSTTLGIPGIARINLSPITQKIVGCVIGENVSTEYPWVYVRKKIIEDNIDLHEDSSDFLPVKDEIYKFPNSKMLIGYVPSLTEEGQFYICLTEEGRDAIVEYIQKEREDHENRVRTAVYKPIGKWKELTSSVEIDSMIVKNTRPLLEIELVSTADVLNAPIHFEDRKVDDVRDGYIELLPYRQIFENIPRKLLYNETQITPEYRTVKIQTELSIPINRWVQYEYTYQRPDIKKFTPEEQESLKVFLRYFTDYICDQLLVNATWDIYCNDYEDLVKNIRDTQCPIPITYKEYLSFHDEKHVVNKVINDLTWHPFWTGVVFTAYTSFAKSQHLIGPKSDEEIIKAYDNNYALVWSFNDSLVPKLVLECPREVTSVTVVIWHIPGKIEAVETVIVHTAAQIRHKIVIKSLITWMQEALRISLIRPTAMSSLKESQKAAVTQIAWIPSYNSIDSSGRITSLPKDTSIDDLSSQFLTASQDGDFGCVTWEGYDFTTDLTINTEICRWIWYNKIHDGPVTHAVRNRQDANWIATIGGKIFAVWKENFGLPVMWKKLNIGLTAVSWGSYRPTVLILTRTDGTVELWDFQVKTDSPCVTQSLSGRIITGIYPHDLRLDPQCIGFCDFNGILRMFLSPGDFLKVDLSDMEWMKNFIQHQVARAQNCKEWREKWFQANYVDIEEKRLAQEAEKKKQEEEEKRIAVKTIEPETTLEPVKKLKRWEMIEDAREKWKARELKHMQEVLLEKKGLKKDDLERQREPILKLRQEAQRKKKRLQETLKMQEDIFEHTKNLFFPAGPPPEIKPILPPKEIDLITVEDTILEQEDIQVRDPNEEIINHFKKTQATIMTELQKKPFTYMFNWKQILRKGKRFRDTLARKLSKKIAADIKI